MGKTDTAWEAWGRTDPYFGVVSHSNFRKDRIAENRDDFFDRGSDLITARITAYEGIFGPLPRHRALDFGCGVGRLTLPLARAFDSVTGLDIAPSMLAEAERNAADAGLANIDFALSDDDLTRAEGGFDFVHTYIVLQHIPVRRGMAIIARLIEKVQSGGGFFLHFSVHTRGVTWRGAYWLVHHLPLGYAVNSVLKRRPVTDPAMQMNGYSLTDILAQLNAAGITQTHVTSESHHGVLTFAVLGRKP